MLVHLAFDAKERVAGVFSRREDAERASVLPVQAWIVDGPELGPTTYLRTTGVLHRADPGREPRTIEFLSDEG